jgi:putative ABC transport system permease protein
MFYNLALKNVLRSFKDYSIYFLTLTFGVCIFYVFNSMDSQQVMLDFTARQSSMIYFMLEMIGIVSGFISVVLAGLVLYANNFILRRRKREFGLYMTMGVQRRRIALMLLCESAVIGVLSLAAGLALGLLLSQMLSVVVSKIYHVAVINYHFVISVSSLVKTLRYFAVIFVIVAALNVFTISKARLIHLLHADRRNEGTFITRHLWVSVLLFLASAALLGGAYAWILKIKLYELGWSLLIIIVMGCVGTLLFFLSLSGFLLKAAQLWRGFYYKHLNMFVLRQLTSKLGSTFGSMAMVCLMLFLTIGALGSAVGMNEAIDDNFVRSTPFDVTLRSEYDILEDLEKIGGDGGLLQNTHQYPVLITCSRFDQLTEPYKRYLPGYRATDYAQTGASFYGVSVEDYNACMRRSGHEELDLPEGKFAVYCTYKPMMDVFRAAERDGASIEVAGATLAAGPLVQQSMRTESVTGIEALLILPADVAARLEPTAYTLVGDYAPGIEDGTDRIEALWTRLNELHPSEDRRLDVFYETKEALYDSNIGTYGTIMFIGIYIGLVFLIASAAVLSIQQLSQSSDDQERYRLLRKIGTDEKMIAAAQTRQIALYFLMPLGLAALHSWVGLYVVTDTLSSFGNFNILSTVLYIAFFVLVIYGGYFLATCWGAKHIIRERAQA